MPLTEEKEFVVVFQPMSKENSERERDVLTYTCTCICTHYPSFSPLAPLSLLTSLQRRECVTCRAALSY